ncbi:hypothetical protein [Rubellicoccus peritrichatus]|uniref:Uncharacterized protein n=1 Tax=Rubellicoccus peritrichatus TaxID=3080537 RepID=A0AAQ3LB74_9BACT|nr:hypothetical protein [Puniceicoccus sp. CR14]WOO40288.1 hypothetical protein RZN69_16840 [Puniceicoccus sp. CR14]
MKSIDLSFFNKLLTFFFSLFIFMYVASAEGDLRTIQFSTISFGEVPRNLWYENEGRLMELTVGGEVRGPMMSYAGDSLIEFFQFVPGNGNELKRLPQGNALIPNGVKQALLCFFPASKSNERLSWNIFIMDDSLESFGGGDICFVNLTGKTVAAVMDNERVHLKPGDFEIVDSQPYEELGGLGIKLAIYLEDKWEPFFSSRWSYLEGERLIIFFLTNEKTDKVEIKAVSQSIFSAALFNQNL